MSKREVMDQFKEDVALATRRNTEANITIEQALLDDFDSIMQSEAWKKFASPIPIEVREHYSNKEVQRMMVQVQNQVKQPAKEPTTMEEVEATIPALLAQVIKLGLCNPDDPADIKLQTRLLLVDGCKKAGIPVPRDPDLDLKKKSGSIADRLGLPDDDEDVPHGPSDPDVYTMFDEE